MNTTTRGNPRPERGTFALRLKNGCFGQTPAEARCLAGAAVKLLVAFRVLAFRHDGAKGNYRYLAAEAGIALGAVGYCIEELKKTKVPDYAKDPTGNTPFPDGRTFLVVHGKGAERRYYPIDGRCQVTAPAPIQPERCSLIEQRPFKVCTPDVVPTIGPRARILDPVLDQNPNVNVGFLAELQPEKPNDACVVSFEESGMGNPSDYAPQDGGGIQATGHEAPVQQPVDQVDQVEPDPLADVSDAELDRMAQSGATGIRVIARLERERRKLARQPAICNQTVNTQKPVDPEVLKPPPPPARQPAPVSDTPVSVDTLVKRLYPGAPREHALAFAEHMVSAWNDGGSRGFYLWVAGHVVDGKITSSELLRTCKAAVKSTIRDRKCWFNSRIREVIYDADIRLRKAAAVARSSPGGVRPLFGKNQVEA